MNRPRLRDYQADDDYVDDLEKYCDELEEKVIEWGMRDAEHFGECRTTKKELLKYEKALNKACERLEDNDINFYYFLKKAGKEYKMKSSENWLKWCLKNG